MKHNISPTKKQLKTKAGYSFSEQDAVWALDKNSKVRVMETCNRLEDFHRDGFVKTLSHYARYMSGSHTEKTCNAMLHLLHMTEEKCISANNLINYRALSTPYVNSNLEVLRIFFKKWWELGYEGVDESIVELLYSWRIKNHAKGDAVKRLDPESGPLTEIELLAFNEGIVQSFEQDKISLSELAIALVISNTGRRSIQISHLKIKDLLKGKNKKNESIYLLSIPRAKQIGASFRSEFNTFSITFELWVILSSQVKKVVSSIEMKLGLTLNELDKQELPLFPDYSEFSKIGSSQELRILLKLDKLHIRSSKITDVIQKAAKKSEIYSERTGGKLAINAMRFRYTVGTRAAREGFGELVIAELLDHSDTQSAGVYVKNIPEHVEKLDQAIGHQLAPYAQAFAGALIDSEKDAIHADDLNSRIKHDRYGIGSCGDHHYCGSNVPIPCYTCMHFQPWVEAPHEMVYDGLLVERKRILDTTGDPQMSVILDRSILAVAEVIQRCTARKLKLDED